MKPFALKELIPTEADEAECLLQWAQIKRHQSFRVSDYLIHVPNGVKLVGDAKQRAIQMARMKRCGFKAGVFDYLLAIPIDPYPGLWLELKRTRLSIVSPEQYRFDSVMRAMGWATAICKGWDEAKSAIEGYLHGQA